MERAYGGHTMWAPLRRVIVKRPEAAFGEADPAVWHYAAQPDLAQARAEHDGLVALLRASGAEVIYHDEEQLGCADAIFTFDPALVTDAGAVLLAMSKALRRGEEEALGRRLEAAGVPIMARLEDGARAECGDLLWVDPETLAVGQGFRTNAEGLRQLREALGPLGVAVQPVHLPYYTGPEACLHLLSLISIVDEKLAVVYLPLLAVPFVQELERRGFELIEVPEGEFATMGPNVLAVGPRDCVMLEGNPVTQGRLEAAGCRVRTYRGQELSLKAEGGPTCLTRPVLRG